MGLFQKINAAVAIPFVLLLSLFVALAITSHNQKKIFILQSYYTDYLWVNQIDNGIDSVLGKQNIVKIKRYYMDTKRHSDPAFIKKSAETAKKLIDAERPDVLIAIDDDAQDYVGKYYKDSKNMAILAYGMNAEPEAYGYDKAKNVSCLLEKLPLKALEESARIILKDKVHGRKIKALHVGDRSKTVLLDDKYIHSFSAFENIEFLPSKLIRTLDEWKKAVLDANSEIDVLFLSNSGKQLLEHDGSTKLVNSQELLSWTLKNCKHPVIGTNQFLVDEGLPFAISVPPVEYGIACANLALKIINENIPMSEISERFPTSTTSQFVVSMRQKQLEELKWNLPDIYDSFARGIRRCL